MSAQATWRSATSTHFVVYTEGSEASAKEIAVKLEKFEFVMRAVSGVTRPGSPIRTKVYMMPDSAAVQATMPFGGSPGVAGYFDGDMRGPYAVMTRSDTGESFGLAAQTVLFHELSHQFMFRFFPAAYPTWYVEGFADFYGTMTIDQKDRVEIGRPLDNRFLAFTGNNWMPIAKVLSARNYGDVTDVSMLYSEGWLLVHYLSTADKRSGQLQKYLSAINTGASFEDAARVAFGDLGELNKELLDYSDRNRQRTIVLPFKQIDPGKVELATLTPAQQALIGYDIRLNAGVPASAIAEFADQVAVAAKRFPDDAYALDILTESLRRAGRDKDALDAVAHWIQVAPTDGLPLMHQAAIELAALRAAKETDPAKWNAVRHLLVRANTLTPNNPRILRTYYDTYAAQGLPAPQNAQVALLAAFDLLPEVEGLRLEVALDFERRGEYQDAIRTIKPIAYTLRADADLSPAQKAREAKEKARYRMAGQPAEEGDTPRKVLERLERELSDAKPK